MDLWSDQYLKKAQRMENSHQLNSFLELPQREPLQLQRAYGSHVSKMHCSAAPYDKTDSSQEAATIPPPPREYFYFVFFLAEEFPLPESKGSTLPHKVPLPPSLLSPQTKEKYPDLSNVGFPSLDDEVACLMSQPLSVRAYEVPLLPSPPPAEAGLHMGDTHEKKYPDLKNIGFPSLDHDTDPKLPKLLLQDVPLPPGPPPAEAVLHMGDTHKKKYPKGENLGFPSLDDKVACLVSQPFSVMACEVPLPPSPPPADAARHVRHFHEKKYPDLKNIGFPSLDDDTDPQHPNLLPQEVPLPSSPVLHMGDTHEKKYPDLKNTGFPSLDDELACLISLSPPPVEIPHLVEKKYLNLSIVAFPCLDDDI